MNKQENKLALSVLTTLISGIALIYTLIMYHNIIFAVMGMSLLFLICAYILTQNIISFTLAKNKMMNSQLKDYINDISEQLENMSGAQSQLGKATFLYTKQAAQTVATLENNYMESQEALYKNLTSISNAQNKATKLMIKYDQNNTTKVISTIKELRNQLSDTMIQGFDQIQPNNAEVIGALEDIVTYLKSQPNVPDQTLSLQLNNVAHELQNISNSMQHFQMPVQNVVQAAPLQTATPITETSAAETIAPTAETTSVAETDSVADIATAPVEENISVDTTTSVVDTTPTVSNDDIADLFASMEEPTVEAEENTLADVAEQPALETLVSEKPVAEEATVAPISEDPNKQLSADEIAALFAAAEPTPKKEAELAPSAEETTKEEPFTPTFTVVGKSDEYMEEHKEDVVSAPTISDMSDDPNKQLSADEIAALFAAADPAPKKAEKPIVEEMKTPTLDDPNKQLSADEIAALFAAAEPAPKAEPSEEEMAMDAALANAQPSVAPISDDPNKQLSADEIAALFASLG
ncbi:MAG: hypothetical protein IJP29_04245 [Lachnospiraceae bacterium]|nr:hypothetical protein [Lachnospiraceae bacterium]